MKQGGGMKKGWALKKFGDVYDVRDGTHDSPKYIEKGFPLITSKNLKSDVLTYDKVQYISKFDYDKINQRSKVHKGDLLFAMIGTIGNPVLINNEPDFAIKNVALFKIPNSQSNSFLKYYLQTPFVINKMETDAKGTTQKFVGLGYLRNFHIFLPSLSEQHRIVTILDEAFAAIAKAKENAEKNLANAREVFNIYMNNFFTNNDKKWKETTIGDVCKNVEYGTASKSNEKGKIPVLRMGNIQNRRFVWDSLVYTDDETEINKYLLKNNDVLFNRTNSPELVGKSAIYKGEMPSIFAGYLIRLHRKENLIDADYLNYYLSSDKAINFGKTVVISSVNQANINGTKLKTYPIPIPPLSEQQAFVTKLDNLSAETKKLEAIYHQKLSDLDELKKSILEKAFAGELNTEKT